MLDKELKPKACREFEAEILVLYHSTTISSNYQAVVHCGVAQQTARILDIDKEYIRTGDKAKVRFRFMYWPEYLKEGSRLIFREGRTKGIGRVTRSIPEEEELGDVNIKKRSKKKFGEEGDADTATKEEEEEKTEKPEKKPESTATKPAFKYAPKKQEGSGGGGTSAPSNVPLPQGSHGAHSSHGKDKPFDTKTRAPVEVKKGHLSKSS